MNIDLSDKCDQMPLEEIFTKKNLAILEFMTENEVHIRDIADMLKISPAKVHNAVRIFKKYGLVNERQLKNKKIISLDQNSVLLKKIIEIIKIEKGEKGRKDIAYEERERKESDNTKH